MVRQKATSANEARPDDGPTARRRLPGYPHASASPRRRPRLDSPYTFFKCDPRRRKAAVLRSSGRPATSVILFTLHAPVSVARQTIPLRPMQIIGHRAVVVLCSRRSDFLVGARAPTMPPGVVTNRQPTRSGGTVHWDRRPRARRHWRRRGPAIALFSLRSRGFSDPACRGKTTPPLRA